MPPRLPLSLAVLLALAGCARPQYVEFHRIGPAQAPSLYAVRYAGAARNPLHELRIDLDRAPPFLIRLPDGQWLASRGLSGALLVAHGMRIERYGPIVSAIWHPHFSLLEVLGNRHYALSFDLAADGHAERLVLAACGRSQAQVLRSADGTRSFGFPLGVAGLRTLFGATEVERLYILTGLSCL